MRSRTALLVVGGALAMLAASFSIHDSTALADGDHADAIDLIWAIKDDARWEIEWWIPGNDLNAAKSEAEVMAVLDHAKANMLEINDWAQSAMWWVADDADWLEPVAAAYHQASRALADHTSSSIGIAEDRAMARLDEIRLDVLTKIDIRLRNGQGKIDDILSDFGSALVSAGSAGQARAARDQALDDLEQRRGRTMSKLDHQRDRYPSHPDVQAAYADATTSWSAAVDAAANTVSAMYAAWEFPAATTTTTTKLTTTTVPAKTTTTPATTTTTVSPTTTTTTTTVPTTTTTSTMIPPTSTTTVSPTPPLPSTTTTTLAPAALLPPTDPPVAELAFMPKVPAPVVSAASAEASAAAEGEGEMGTVGLVRRVVDSQLPAGVATVAAGPLVVLGLIIDAIRAAGGLLVVPWLLLGIYMAGLLRGWRGFTELN